MCNSNYYQTITHSDVHQSLRFLYKNFCLMVLSHFYIDIGLYNIHTYYNMHILISINWMHFFQYLLLIFFELSMIIICG